MRRLVLSIAALSALVAVPVITWAQDRPWNAWGMHPMSGAWGAWGIGMMLVMFGFSAVVIAGIVLGIRWLVTQGREPGADRALAVLRERYARGEIDREEFEAKRRDLDAA